MTVLLHSNRHQAGEHWARQTGSAEDLHGWNAADCLNDLHSGKGICEPGNIRHHAVPRWNNTTLEGWLSEQNAFATAGATKKAQKNRRTNRRTIIEHSTAA